MEVILLERVAKLGQMGDVVRVKDGFARNYLLPKGKALRATDENRAHFQGMKVQLEAQNLEQKSEAKKIAEKLDGSKVTVLRQAAEGGQLYGSVSPRDIASLLGEQGFAITRAQVALDTPIKTIGLHKIPITLHPEVEVTVELTVARNADEAQRIARGEDITAVREESAEEDAEAAEAFFEPEAVEAQRAPQSEKAETPPPAPEPSAPAKRKSAPKSKPVPKSKPDRKDK
jgi:large subunit ribosomal protein L9